MALNGQVIEAGEVTGEMLISAEPLSFWGGYDYHTGNIIDQRHPLAGECAAGRILALPFTRGSSSTTAILLEAVKVGTAPAAIITTAPDSFFALASIVADEMYNSPIPLITLDQTQFAQLQNGQTITIQRDGTIDL